MKISVKNFAIMLFCEVKIIPVHTETVHFNTKAWLMHVPWNLTFYCLAYSCWYSHLMIQSTVRCIMKKKNIVHIHVHKGEYTWYMCNITPKFVWCVDAQFVFGNRASIMTCFHSACIPTSIHLSLMPFVSK